MNKPNKSPQRNAGSRPFSDVSSASASPSLLGPRCCDQITIGQSYMNLRKILNDPDRYVEVRDDKIAQRLVVELGVIDQLAHPGPVSTPLVKLATLDTLKTHIVAAFRFVGHEKKKDNGYVVKFYPRSSFSLDQVDRAIHADMAGIQAAAPFVRRRFSTGEHLN